MKIMAAFLLGLVVSFASRAGTTPDATGLWHDPAHPGWGVGIWQQGTTAFATLFTYDANGAPVWYVASNLQFEGVTGDPCGYATFGGSLARTTWPGFSPINPPPAVQVEPVGGLGLIMLGTAAPGTGGCTRNTALLTSLIDGLTTTVGVERLTFGSDRALLAGAYSGGVYFGVPPDQCPDLNDSPYLPTSQRQLTLSVSGNGADSVSIVWGTGIDTLCSIDGAYSQQGQLGQLVGSFSCRVVGGGMPTEPPAIQLSDIAVSDAGFSARLALQNGSCHYSGTIAGARH